MQGSLVLTSFVALPLVSAAAAYLYFVRFALHRGSRWRLARLVSGNLLLLAVSISVLGLLGELYFRFLVDTTDAFALTLTTRRWYARHFHTNGAGFRDDLAVYAAARTEGRRRISFVGDSFTAGHGIPEVEDRFANRIRNAHPEWEVHVLAQPGWDTGHHLSLLRDMADSGYELDVVVLVTCVNDVADLIPEWRKLVRRIYGEQPGLLVEHSYLFNTLYYRRRARRSDEIGRYYDLLAAAYEGGLWERQKQRLRALHQAVKERGGTLVVVLFPFLGDAAAEEVSARAEEALTRFWQGLGVRHLNLGPVFEGHNPGALTVNRFDPHPNERAHELAAASIGAFLEAELPSIAK